MFCHSKCLFACDNQNNTKYLHILRIYKIKHYLIKPHYTIKITYLQFTQILANAFNSLSFPFHVLPLSPFKRICSKFLVCLISIVEPSLFATTATAFAA